MNITQNPFLWNGTMQEQSNIDMSHDQATYARWYTGEVGPKLGPTARQILEGYAGIPTDQLENHVSKIRDQAWQIYPYPCFGRFRFLEFNITLSSQYASILSIVNRSPSALLLDLGCGVGQEIRALAAAGAPSSQLIGCDLRSQFWELGYELFNDKGRLESRFIEADIMQDGDRLPGELKELEGKLDVIWIGSFLHLFDIDGQRLAVEKVIKLSKPEKGAVVLGKQAGGMVAGEVRWATDRGERRMFRHSEESFRAMWDEVGEKTGSNWRVETEMAEFEGEEGRQRNPDTRRLMFVVVRE